MEMTLEKQPVDALAARPLLARLLERQAASLVGWYADPVSSDTARTLADTAQSGLGSRLCEGDDCSQLHVLLLACHFWMGGSIELDYEQLAASTGNARERALLELVYGQLLISCKYRPACQHLARGFSLAVDHLGTSDYFYLVRQHELLAYLPLSSRPSAPLDLESLLTEARVIKRLQAGSGWRHDNAHHDTVG